MRRVASAAPRSSTPAHDFPYRGRGSGAAQVSVAQTADGNDAERATEISRAVAAHVRARRGVKFRKAAAFSGEGSFGRLKKFSPFPEWRVI